MEKNFQLSCLFLFDKRIQDLLYDFGPGGVLAYIQAKAMIEDSGGVLELSKFYRIADYCHIDKMLLDVIDCNYDLFENDGEFIWLKGNNPDEGYLKELPYKEFLQTDYWKEVAAKVKKLSGFKCSKCGSSKQLEVHHLNYDHHGDEMNHLEDLVCICHSCHLKEHNK